MLTVPWANEVPFSASEDGDQLLWCPGVVAESKVKEYLIEAAFRTGNEKPVDRASAGALTRDNEQVGASASADAAAAPRRLTCHWTALF